jgi:hypothetical protein
MNSQARLVGNGAPCEMVICGLVHRVSRRTPRNFIDLSPYYELTNFVLENAPTRVSSK